MNIDEINRVKLNDYLVKYGGVKENEVVDDFEILERY